jgi:hypothetical protein
MAGEDGGSVQEERASLPFLCLLIPFSSSTDWMMATCTGENNPLYLVYNSNANLFQKYPYRRRSTVFTSYLDIP